MKLTYRIILILAVSLCIQQSYSQIVLPKWVSHITNPNKRYLKALMNQKSAGLNTALGVHVEKNSFVGDTTSDFVSLIMELNMDTDNTVCTVMGKIRYSDSCGPVTADIELEFTRKHKMNENIGLMVGTLKGDYDLASIGVFMLGCNKGVHGDVTSMRERFVGPDNKVIQPRTSYVPGQEISYMKNGKKCTGYFKQANNDKSILTVQYFNHETSKTEEFQVPVADVIK